MQKAAYYIIHCLVFIVTLSAAPQQSYAEKTILEVIYPSPKSDNDIRDIDIIEILRTALQKTESSDGPFSLKPSKVVLSSIRAHEELKRGVLINVIFETVTPEFEQMFLPIRIPVRKGLLGYRIFLIQKQDQDKFSAITGLEELKQFKVGQGKGWSDVKLFEANGFQVVRGSDYEGLFTMLVSGRFDFFSRGINEVYAEYASRKDMFPNLWIEEHLLLYYPFPKYIFVTKQMPQLADRIERGMTMMLKDGSYDRIFWKYHAETIKAAKIDKRKLIKIKNHLLPVTVPFKKKHLWFDPFEKSASLR